MSWDSDTNYTSSIALKCPELEKILLMTLFYKEDTISTNSYFDIAFLDSSANMFENTVGGAYFDPKFSIIMAKKLIDESRDGRNHRYLDGSPWERLAARAEDELADDTPGFRCGGWLRVP